MPDREYPTEALKAAAGSCRGEQCHYFPVGECCRVKYARESFDRLAAMSPEDRAALAAWLWPEDDEKVRRALRVRAATAAHRGGKPIAFPSNPPRVADCEAALTLAEQHVATVTAERDQIEAATVERITARLRSQQRATESVLGLSTAAELIEHWFGGLDAVAGRSANATAGGPLPQMFR